MGGEGKEKEERGRDIRRQKFNIINIKLNHNYNEYQEKNVCGATEMYSKGPGLAQDIRSEDAICELRSKA